MKSLNFVKYLAGICDQKDSMKMADIIFGL